MQLAPQQQQAFEKIVAWHRDPNSKPCFYLGGWAGTGKTSCARTVVEELVDLSDVILAAYTGKAAYQLSISSGLDARTCHSVIYCSSDASEANLKRLTDELRTLKDRLTAEAYDELAIANHPQVGILEGKILVEEKNAKRPHFSLNPNSDLHTAKMGLLDEVSMIDERMAKDWLSFGKKTLVLGDPFQLPPVMGEGFFTRHEPNYMLTEIHRQAEGNPIIYLASLIRGMERPSKGTYGTSLVAAKDSFSKAKLADLMLEADQVIVGRNKTRHAFNSRIRQLRGITSRLPVVGEKLVCLRNNAELGIMNGALYIVTDVVEAYPEIDRIDLVVQPVEGGRKVQVHCHTQHFLGEEEALRQMWYSKKEAQEFDFGYALTCHKAQGSQFGNVLVWDESSVAREHAYRWLYTAATRPQQRLTLMV